MSLYDGFVLGCSALYYNLVMLLTFHAISTLILCFKELGLDLMFWNLMIGSDSTPLQFMLQS